MRSDGAKNWPQIAPIPRINSSNWRNLRQTTVFGARIPGIKSLAALVLLPLMLSSPACAAVIL
jgi:hypothetical protein